MIQRILGRRAAGAMAAAAVGLAVAVIAVVTGAPAVTAQQHAGEYMQEDIVFGMQVYQDNCVGCHGPDGDLVSGVNLRSGEFPAAQSDRELQMLIAQGIPDTAMPPGDYTSSELTGLVAYLRTMNTFDAGDVAIGDAARGEAIYNGAGDCASCHRIGNEGSRTAPNLSAIARIRTAANLAAALVDPTGSMLPLNRPVRIVTNDGATHNGRRLNEDTYTVQIIDDNERLHSFDKADLREFTILTESTMPSYAETLTDQERADVVAFLLTLRGM